MAAIRTSISPRTGQDLVRDRAVSATSDRLRVGRWEEGTRVAHFLRSRTLFDVATLQLVRAYRYVDERALTGPFVSLQNLQGLTDPPPACEICHTVDCGGSSA